MDAVCLVVFGIVRAALPVTEFTLGWEHSVEKTRWEERYRVEGDRLALLEARIQGLGAGMEPSAGATLRDGWWQWQPKIEPLPELRLTYSAYARDYRLCWANRCQELATLIGGGLAPGDVVSVRACERAPRRPALNPSLRSRRAP